MKKIIEQADRLLAMLSVSGDSVMLLADARKLLGELYRMAPEGEEKGSPARARRSGSRGERRNTGMSELWPQAEANDMEVATTT